MAERDDAAGVAGDFVNRVLMTTDAVGGIWQHSVELATGLAERGDEVVLAVTGPAPTSDRRDAVGAVAGVTLVDTGLPLDWLAPDAATVTASGQALAELARRCGATVVQLNAPSLAAGVRFDAPVVAVTHSCTATWWQAVEGGSLPEDFAWRATLMSRGLRSADQVVAPTAAFAEATRQTYQLPEPPAVVFNGRDMPAAAPAAMADFALTAGRLWDRGKDLATLDRAAARLAVPFRAAGATTGPNGENVRLAHLIGLGQLGEARLGELLAARPVFVSAARYEPFGLAVLEAAAAGCALVLADIATFRELWDGAATFVAPGDERGFAAAVEAVIGDRQRRLDLGRAAQARAARFTPAAMVDGMAAIYRSLAAAGARVAA